MDDFAGDYRFEMQRVRASETVGKRRPTRMVELPAGEIPQGAVRAFCPPGASLWRNNIGGGWCGHYAPFARVSALNMTSGGSRGALLRVLRMLWRQHIQFTGADDSICHVAGLLSEGQPAAAAGNASIGSGRGGAVPAVDAAIAPIFEAPPAPKAKRAKKNSS